MCSSWTSSHISYCSSLMDSLSINDILSFFACTTNFPEDSYFVFWNIHSLSLWHSFILKTLLHNGDKESSTLIESCRTHNLYWEPQVLSLYNAVKWLFGEKWIWLCKIFQILCDKGQMSINISIYHTFLQVQYLILRKFFLKLTDLDPCRSLWWIFLCSLYISFSPLSCLQFQ